MALLGSGVSFDHTFLYATNAFSVKQRQPNNLPTGEYGEIRIEVRGFASKGSQPYRRKKNPVQTAMRPHMGENSWGIYVGPVLAVFVFKCVTADFVEEMRDRVQVLPDTDGPNTPYHYVEESVASGSTSRPVIIRNRPEPLQSMTAQRADSIGTGRQRQPRRQYSMATPRISETRTRLPGSIEEANADQFRCAVCDEWTSLRSRTSHYLQHNHSPPAEQEPLRDRTEVTLPQPRRYKKRARPFSSSATQSRSSPATQSRSSPAGGGGQDAPAKRSRGRRTTRSESDESEQNAEHQAAVREARAGKRPAEDCSEVTEPLPRDQAGEATPSAPFGSQNLEELARNALNASAPVPQDDHTQEEDEEDDDDGIVVQDDQVNRPETQVNHQETHLAGVVQSDEAMPTPAATPRAAPPIDDVIKEESEDKKPAGTDTITSVDREGARRKIVFNHFSILKDHLPPSHDPCVERVRGERRNEIELVEESVEELMLDRDGELESYSQEIERKFIRQKLEDFMLEMQVPGSLVWDESDRAIKVLQALQARLRTWTRKVAKQFIKAVIREVITID